MNPFSDASRRVIIILDFCRKKLTFKLIIIKYKLKTAKFLVTKLKVNRIFFESINSIKKCQIKYIIRPNNFFAKTSLTFLIIFLENLQKKSLNSILSRLLKSV